MAVVVVRRFCRVLGGLFSGMFDGVKVFIPELFEGLDPGVDGAEGLGVEGVEALAAALMDADKADGAEDGEVLGDGGLG